MTKPVTGVALMQLWEQGKFGLDDKLSDYLPEFAQTPVFVNMDNQGNPILRQPHRPILIRDVLRHTAGFGYGPGSSYPEQAFAKADPLNFDHDLSEFGRRLATVPLLFEPGTRWNYSAGVDVQGLLVRNLLVRFESYQAHIFVSAVMKAHRLDPSRIALRPSPVGYRRARTARLSARARRHPPMPSTCPQLTMFVRTGSIARRLHRFARMR